MLRIFSAATADTPEARQEALQELRAAGTAYMLSRALFLEYKRQTKPASE